MSNVTSRITIASAAALIALSSLAAMTTSVHAAEKEQVGRCYGVNSCKGTSLCATAHNDCKGLNECKGQGVLVKTPTECQALGGTLTEPK